MTLEQLLFELKNNLTSYYLHYSRPAPLEFRIGLPSRDNIQFSEGGLLNSSITITATLNDRITQNLSIPSEDLDTYFLIQDVYTDLRVKLADEGFRKRQEENLEELQARTTALISRF